MLGCCLVSSASRPILPKRKTCRSGTTFRDIPMAGTPRSISSARRLPHGSWIDISLTPGRRTSCRRIRFRSSRASRRRTVLHLFPCRAWSILVPPLLCSCFTQLSASSRSPRLLSLSSRAPMWPRRRISARSSTRVVREEGRAMHLARRPASCPILATLATTFYPSGRRAGGPERPGLPTTYRHGHPGLTRSHSSERSAW